MHAGPPSDISSDTEADLLARIDALEATRAPAPAVTIIIAAYNVARYLPTAVRSALTQTLRSIEVLIVDDHSTDGTLETAVQLAEADTRVRVLRTTENSGGPGVPRNLGITEARAPYYTFLDGDDTLETHACKVLLDAAQRTGADVVIGRTERFHVSTGKAYPWYGGLFGEARSDFVIEDFPELFDDTIAAGKLYRRSFTVGADNWLLEGVHYEDLVFTARAYAEATSLSLVPATTYRWHVYPADERKSITAQRDDLRNLEHRLRALDILDDAVADSAGPRMKAQIKRKFLKHDARIYLNQALLADDEWLLSVCRMLTPRVEMLSADDWSLVDVWQRLVYGCVLAEDLAGIRQAILFTTQAGMTAGRLVPHGSRTFWQPAGTKGALPPHHPTAAMLLDVSDDHLNAIPPIALRPHHTLTCLEVIDDQLLLEGTTDDFGTWFHRDVSHSLTVTLRRFDESYRAPIRYIDERDGLRIWRAAWTIPKDFPVVRPQIWDFAIRTQQQGRVVISPILTTADTFSGRSRLSIGTLVGRLFGRQLELYRTTTNHLAMKLTGATGSLRSADKAVAGAAVIRGRAIQAGRRATRRLTRTRGYAQMRKLPIDDSAVFCESMMGGSAWDSPRYVAEVMRRLRPDLTVYWAYQGTTPELPAGFVPIERWSTEYLHRAATSRFIIDNQTLPTFFRKRPEQRYLQTWHGIPLKAMGLDSPELKYSFPAQQEELIARGHQWDGLVSPNLYFEDTFVRAYRYRGELIRGGAPRNDVLVTQADDRAAAKRRLGVPHDRTIVLYAPTFRNAAADRSVVSPGEVLDLSGWVDTRGADSYLLVRAHYLDRVSVPRSISPYALDVSDYPNVNDLYLAADVLVTDYSSVMFDYATLRRPIVLFPYDYDEYVHSERGTYFDLIKRAPGPVVSSFAELIDAIGELAAGGDAHAEALTSAAAYRQFVADFCGAEDGHAAQRSAEFLLSGAHGVPVDYRAATAHERGMQ